MDGPEHIPTSTDDSTAGRLARVERQTELLRQAVFLLAETVQQLRQLTLPREAAR